jgi:hypothetical protein
MMGVLHDEIAWIEEDLSAEDHAELQVTSNQSDATRRLWRER